ncbi:MAG: membrane protein insertion efficiency factor YidD [Bacteroidia bacterium]|nr:membrane protein insertion efficiency factor YidD [Bacteroidia bacterium]
MPFFWNPLKLVAWTALFAYQKEITYQVHAHCIYTPSCSEYTKSAISRYGLAKGTMMGLDRLSRCNPFDAKKAQKTGLSKGRPADDPTLEAW